MAKQYWYGKNCLTIAGKGPKATNLDVEPGGVIPEGALSKESVAAFTKKGLISDKEPQMVFESTGNQALEAAQARIAELQAQVDELLPLGDELVKVKEELETANQTIAAMGKK